MDIVTQALILFNYINFHLKGGSQSYQISYTSASRQLGHLNNSNNQTNQQTLAL